MKICKGYFFSIKTLHQSKYFYGVGAKNNLVWGNKTTPHCLDSQQQLGGHNTDITDIQQCQLPHNLHSVLESPIEIFFMQTEIKTKQKSL